MKEIFRIDLTRDELRFITGCLCLGASIKEANIRNTIESIAIVKSDSFGEDECVNLIGKLNKITLHLKK